MGIVEDTAAARAMGLSYGKYKALTYNPQNTPKKEDTPPAHSKKKSSKYTDKQLFELWQEGKTDAEIGAAVGVSRAMIQKWRDKMELPSTSKRKINTKKYRLVDTEYGPYIVLQDDLL